MPNETNSQEPSSEANPQPEAPSVSTPKPSPVLPRAIFGAPLGIVLATPGARQNVVIGALAFAERHEQAVTQQAARTVRQPATGQIDLGWRDHTRTMPRARSSAL